MVRDLTSKHQLYFEATLQLRDVTPEMISFAMNEIERTGMRISKLIELESGLDLRLSDKALSKALGRKMQSFFGGEYKESATIFSQKDGKDIYRLTVLFRGMKAKKGDNIKYRGEEYKIVLVGKDVLLQEVGSGKKIHVKFGEIKDFKKV